MQNKEIVQTNLSQASFSPWKKELAKEKESPEKVQNQKPDYLSKYGTRNHSDVLVQKADITVSFLNPKLQTRQEMSLFVILSADGKQCLKLIKQYLFPDRLNVCIRSSPYFIPSFS